MALLDRPLILDAAMGTALGSPPHAPAFNLSDPERVLAIHRSHVAAGAQLVLTNTFVGATSEEAAAGLRLARAAGALVGASLFAGLDDLADQIEQLRGADCVWLETATSFSMALRAVQIARRATQLPIAITCAMPSAPLDELRTAGAAAAGYNCAPWPESFHGADILKLDSGRLSPGEWAAAQPRVKLQGGCCGTGAEHLRALR
jgi:methionine synthase I (cobalamin-dependent)